MDDKVNAGEIVVDRDLAREAISSWKKALAQKNPLMASLKGYLVEEADFEVLQRKIVEAIRAAKKQTVESCGFGYYEVAHDDHANPKVLVPILMDKRRVVLQFREEDLSDNQIREIMERWTEALRPKTEYRDGPGH